MNTALEMIDEMIESNDPEEIQATQENSGITDKKVSMYRYN